MAQHSVHCNTFRSQFEDDDSQQMVLIRLPRYECIARALVRGDKTHGHSFRK